MKRYGSGVARSMLMFGFGVGLSSIASQCPRARAGKAAWAGERCGCHSDPVLTRGAGHPATISTRGGHRHRHHSRNNPNSRTLAHEPVRRAFGARAACLGWEGVYTTHLDGCVSAQEGDAGFVPIVQRRREGVHAGTDCGRRRWQDPIGDHHVGQAGRRRARVGCCPGVGGGAGGCVRGRDDVVERHVKSHDVTNLACARVDVWLP
eukprot:scaffold18129_cov101-Isochrysis_galbana.AAC.1